MKLFGVVALVLLSLASVADAGVRSVSRSSSRTQTVYGLGHHVALPAGVYEGVAVATTRREAVRSACYSGDCSKRTVSRSVSRGPGGLYYGSVLYRAR